MFCPSCSNSLLENIFSKLPSQLEFGWEDLFLDQLVGCFSYSVRYSKLIPCISTICLQAIERSAFIIDNPIQHWMSDGNYLPTNEYYVPTCSKQTWHQSEPILRDPVFVFKWRDNDDYGKTFVTWLWRI